MQVDPNLGQMRIPDILETIADLSNDEVFTPPDLANKVLDMLPSEIWSNSKTTFLDPACKTGVFLREITKRLIVGLEQEIPDLQERVNHILTKQVYGLAITELTSLMSRRTVYCATKANSEVSVCTAFDNPEGNIKIPKSKHNFHEKTKKCTICGAGEDLYHEIENRDNYAYSFLHDDLKEVFGDVKFDVIIGNPPYQLNDGGGAETSSVPLYHKFVQFAKELNPSHISFIIPSRWMKGGKGLSNFREEMISEKRIKYMYDFENSQDLFPRIRVDGGICYFLWSKEYNGKVDYTYTSMKGAIDNSIRYLKNKYTENIIRDSKQELIISKVFKNSKSYFNEIVDPRNSFGLHSDLFNAPEKYSEIKVYNKNGDGDLISVHGVEGKGGSKRVTKYIKRNSVKKGVKSIDLYKLYFSKAYGTEATIPPEIISGKPGNVATETFLKIGDFKTEKEMENCLSYIKTKFFRALLFYNRHSLNISRSSFELIPLQDFSKPWTDAELYKKYKLTTEEIAYIEENIEEMK